MREESVPKIKDRELPSGPVARTPCSQCRGPGLIPSQGTRSSHRPQLKKDPDCPTKTGTAKQISL